MNALQKHLIGVIRTEGPLTVARYMAEALGHPEHGYYMKQDPFGANGDFITAPEISQMFGEILGLWIADCWQRQGAPAPLRLVELGPGRGTLMQDAMRAMKCLPGLAEAVDLHLVETSPFLRNHQKKRLTATWHDSLDGVPDGPLFLIANEFFDALPIHQFVRGDDGFQERRIGEKDGKLAWHLGPAEPSDRLPDCVPRGAIIETCPAAQAIIRTIAERIASHGGAALLIDYGYAQAGHGDSLQALKNHQFRDILDITGDADLTAHVNFSALKSVAQKAGTAVYGPVYQGDFLLACGIGARAAALARNAAADQQSNISAALQRLTAADQMGHLFKAMAILPAKAAAPSGFSL